MATRNLFVCYRHEPALIYAGITYVQRTVCPQCVRTAFKIVRRTRSTSGMSLGEVLAYLDKPQRTVWTCNTHSPTIIYAGLNPSQDGICGYCIEEYLLKTYARNTLTKKTK